MAKMLSIGDKCSYMKLPATAETDETVYYMYLIMSVYSTIISIMISGVYTDHFNIGTL